LPSEKEQFALAAGLGRWALSCAKLGAARITIARKITVRDRNLFNMYASLRYLVKYTFHSHQ
jgi:hypothetical protein